MKKIYNPPKNPILSFYYAVRGLGFGFYSQKNLVIHIVFTILAITLGLFLKIEIWEWIALSISITLVIFAEMMNTALELSVDLFTRKKKLRAMLSKDVAAGAVLISVFNSLIIGYLIFGRRLVNIFF
jgi:diacylglycerol kinase (ATP)